MATVNFDVQFAENAYTVQFEETSMELDAQFEPNGGGGGGGGAVNSVNGKTGTVVLDAGDLEYDDSETYAAGSVGAELSSLIGDLNGKLDEPSTAGTNGQVLTSDGQGGQSWQTPQSGGSVSPYTSNPSALGTASAGSSNDYSRGDHVHPMPTPSQVGAEAVTTVVQKTSSDTSLTLEANKFYIFPEMSALTITCPVTGGQYAFRFTSGSTATTLTMTGITMPDSWTVEANKVYEINVFEGYGLAVSWEVSA